MSKVKDLITVTTPSVGNGGGECMTNHNDDVCTVGEF